jgi:hypothetical protein
MSIVSEFGNGIEATYRSVHIRCRIRCRGCLQLRLEAICVCEPMLSPQHSSVGGWSGVLRLGLAETTNYSLRALEFE